MSVTEHQAVIGIGSNIDAEQNIQAAIDHISQIHTLVATAPCEQTSPIGYTDQDDFINTAVLIDTSFDKEHLAIYLKSIERMLGRVRTANKNGPRTIDLDIVVWDGIVLDDDVHTRDFLKRQVLHLLPDINL